jgi:hypothetical protein
VLGIGGWGRVGGKGLGEGGYQLVSALTFCPWGEVESPEDVSCAWQALQTKTVSFDATGAEKTHAELWVRVKIC